MRKTAILVFFTMLITLPLQAFAEEPTLNGVKETTYDRKYFGEDNGSLFTATQAQSDNEKGVNNPNPQLRNPNLQLRSDPLIKPDNSLSNRNNLGLIQQPLKDAPTFEVPSVAKPELGRVPLVSEGVAKRTIQSSRSLGGIGGIDTASCNTQTGVCNPYCNGGGWPIDIQNAGTLNVTWQCACPAGENYVVSANGEQGCS